VAAATLHGLTPFPPERPDRLPEPALFTERGFSLRALRDADLPWLCDLYASTRSDEMAHVPWPDPVKRQFIEQQFTLQHRHYLAHYPEASFWAIEHRNGDAVGNCYLLRTPPEHLIVHISLFPNARNGGLGTALIRQCQTDAAADGCGVRLHVLQTNIGARQLYERLGFVAEAGEGSHLLMCWAP
jgi:ribosomal protein S18 acetylase RimI-like enzyme